MRIKARLQTVASPDQLHAVMHDIRAFGSQDWSYDSVVRFVPAPYWYLLDRYFDSSGRLVARRPADGAAEPGSEASGPDSSELERDGCPNAAGTLSDLIRIFHSRIASLREEARASGSSAGTSPGQPPTVAGSGTMGQRLVVRMATAAPEPLPATDGEPPAEEFEGFFCAICERRSSADPVVCRGATMCPVCAVKIGG